VERDHFERLVEEALAGLPARFASRLDNVTVIIEDWATPEQLAKVNLKDPHQLLGLYEGIPITRRANGYAGALPDRITIFRIPIEEMSATDDDIRRQVRKTVMHELGHYFGMDEEEIQRATGE
jgi:predicted Zn-dependent protease with MMP-like domain